MMPRITGIIPARYASSRFPGKPLVDIGGKTMIRRVYEQAKQAKSLSDVIVATDDERIAKEVEGFGGKVVMTSVSHSNGTERCAELAKDLHCDVVINIQGDEPFIQPAQIDLLAGLFSSGDAEIATLIKVQPFNDELQNPARVKVVVDANMNALYFSRGVIPHLHSHPHFTVQGYSGKAAQDASKSIAPRHTFYKHIGIYGYKKEVLSKIVMLSPSPLEIAEQLEQLRWLENGYKVKCTVTDYEPISIDTPEDLAALKL